MKRTASAPTLTGAEVVKRAIKPLAWGQPKPDEDRRTFILSITVSD